MDVLIWLAVTVYSLSEFVHGESNPYQEALLARPWENEQAYVTVRPGAHMFYWLYYANGTRVDAESKPLIIWIEGGPGLAASGIANFGEIGPFDTKMEPRNHTWVKGHNVLFFDHPVGTGLSYVTNDSLLVKSDREMVVDLSQAIKEFYKTHEAFRKTPTYLFGQDYGSRIIPRLACYLHLEIQFKILEMNLKGIGIGSGMIDPKETTLTYPEFLYHTGLIDLKKYTTSSVIAKEVAKYIDKKKYTIAEEIHSLLTIYLAQEEGRPINFTNINRAHHSLIFEKFETTFNTYVKPMLSHVVDQKIEWKYLSEKVFYNFNESFLTPATQFVEICLNDTDLKVAIFNGNLDAVTPITATTNWVYRLKWKDSENFDNTYRSQIRGGNGFYKEWRKLSLWWVYGAGHWVADDNPEAMEHILEYITSDK